MVDEALRLERSGAPIIHMEKGELGLNTPDVVKESVIRAIRQNRTRYSQSNGIPELREAICKHYDRVYGVEVDPSRVFVNSGSSPAMLGLFLSILSPGDEVIIPNPGYPSYPEFVKASRGKAVWAGTACNGFRYTAEQARPHLSAATRAIVINFPSNPVGQVADGDTLQGFAELGPMIVSDEVYHALVFEGRPRTILEFTDDAVVVGSFSKGYAMTGWRLGYLIVPRPLVDKLQRMQQYLFVGANTFVQWAAITALQNADTIAREIREELSNRRRRTLGRLQELGFKIPFLPQGGFYVFARLPHIPLTAEELAVELLAKAHVAVTPGTEFGSDGDGCIRFSLSTTEDQIDEAMSRIAAFLDHTAKCPV